MEQRAGLDGGDSLTMSIGSNPGAGTKEETMKKEKPNRVIVIRRSCLTGKVVWVYCGTSKRGADTAYWRACRAEVTRVRRWGEKAAERRSRIMAILNAALADLNITATLTPEQKAAAKKLSALSREDIACHREFYEHVIEERRRRAEDHVVRQQMRERARRNSSK